jgi:hypothetical protein
LKHALGKKKQPIEIQRQMKIRSPHVRLPRFIASLSASFADLGPRPDDSLCGCILAEAKKPLEFAR